MEGEYNNEMGRLDHVAYSIEKVSSSSSAVSQYFR